MKKTSLYAISTAAMFAAGMSMASAADLGGNCCADLEERVAELEATVAKKGNRKVSLTISGQVNKLITHWSAGQVDITGNRVAGRTSGTYLGLDNQNSSTRFGLAGSAKINAEYSAGYSILIDVAGGARSNAFTQLNEDTSVNGSSQWNGDYGLRMRDANWWIQSDRVGRLTVGRLVSSGAVGMIDLGAIGVIASVSHGLIGGGLAVADGRSLNNLTDASGDYNPRVDGVKWTSPTIQGFVVSATVGETLRESSFIVGPPVPNPGARDGRTLGIDLKYANEFNGVRVAFGVGYEKWADAEEAPLVGTPNPLAEIEVFGLSGALLHTATGLFIQADYINKEATGLTAAATLPTLTRDADRWNIQAGVTRNFFGIGATALYGEYGRGKGWLEVNRTQSTGIADIGLVANIDSKYDVWGLGVVQNIDAAAMELYMGYRAFSFEEGPTNPAFINSGDVKLFSAGARIKF